MSKPKRNRSNGARKRSRLKPTLELLEGRRMMATFQQGVANYEGQEDTVLYSREPDVNFGTEGSISPDQQDSNGARQGLVKFNDIIGSDPGQIPLGAKITDATFTVDVVNDSNSAMQMSLYRMQTDWTESSATWNTFGAIGGVQASEGESSDLPPDAILFDPDTSASSPTAGIFDVKTSLEYWAAGADNFGWMIESAATNGWDFRTKESAVSQRPKLDVNFTVPASDEFQLLSGGFFAGEGTTATVEVSRLGSLAGAASIDYAVTAGTAGAGDFVATTGTVNFAPGEAFGSFDVEITGDTELEGLETIEVTLSGGTVVSGRDSATITIADDDALINEVVANITNAVDETDREYIELQGTPGASLDDYYFVVFENEEEGDDGSLTDGSASGVADFVYDLSGATFGDNGLLVIAPTNWAYQGLADADTNIINTAQLDGAGGVLEDHSQTYALIRSPQAPMVQGTDYDTIGTYENDTNQAIGTGVGILDQLPAGADLVDSVGVVEGGGGDRDRNSTTAERGHPGVHVHQPTRFTGSTNNVTSDAVSRRFGQTLPNSLGAWFNGDISDGDALAYENDTFFISVVAPDGAVVTPGAPNLLRTAFFSVADQDTEVAEADGSVTITIERTGDTDESVEVFYETVDFGSATGDADYTSVTDSVVFGPGEFAKDVTITILGDDVAEGFERFRLEITGTSDPSYLITNGRSTQAGAVNGVAVVTVADANVEIATFQQGENGYSGTEDGYIDGEQIFDKFGQDPVIRVDQVKGEGEDIPNVIRPQQGLLRFDNMFGDAANQIPEGSTIFGGFLTVNVQNPASGADVRFFTMQQDWEEVNTTWLDPQGSRGSSILNGVTPDDVEASAEPDFRVPDAGDVGLVEIPVNADTLQSWANGSADNFGWSIVSDSGSLWGINSSEAFLTGTFRPELTILYTSPDSSAGSFNLASDEFITNEDESATITINRVGGSTGAATVDWSVSGITGDASDLGGSSGSVSFADGELSKTFDVAITDDIATEANETFEVTISGTGDFGRDVATLTVRDNDFNPFSGDLFLNEMWINSPGNDPPHEFVELKGTPGIGMGSLYYVAVEGLVGDREGSAEKVVDIGAFSNGAADTDGSGYTLLTPDAADFAFRAPELATQIDGLGSIAQENVASQNDSTTYMLLYSPFTRLATSEFDYDWDNDGALELPQGVLIVDSVGVRVLGAQDQLYGPSTNAAEFAVIDPDVDAISRFRNDTTRNEGDSWFGGDLFPAGDDYLLYESAEAFDLPVTGAALTPGEPNTGDVTESPVATLVSVSVSGSTATAVFSDPVQQLLVGDGGPTSPGGSGITITDSNGAPLANVDIFPTVAGLGTDTLTITFTGSGVTGGDLPAGDYLLNFVGNGLVANERAVDVAADGTEINGFAASAFTVTDSGVDGDFDNDGDYDCDDIAALQGEIIAGTNAAAFDLTADGVVDIADQEAWLAEAGNNNIGAPYLPADADLSGAVDVSDFNIWNANKFQPGTWCEGDFNADGSVDVSDFNLWNANKFRLSDGAAAPMIPMMVTMSEANVVEIEVADTNVTAPIEATPVSNSQQVSLRQNTARREESREVEVMDAVFATFEDLA